jgi:hypothetical protein
MIRQQDLFFATKQVRNVAYQTNGPKAGGGAFSPVTLEMEDGTSTQNRAFAIRSRWFGMATQTAGRVGSVLDPDGAWPTGRPTRAIQRPGGDRAGGGNLARPRRISTDVADLNISVPRWWLGGARWRELFTIHPPPLTDQRSIRPDRQPDRVGRVRLEGRPSVPRSAPTSDAGAVAGRSDRARLVGHGAR